MKKIFDSVFVFIAFYLLARFIFDIFYLDWTLTTADIDKGTLVFIVFVFAFKVFLWLKGRKVESAQKKQAKRERKYENKQKKLEKKYR